MKNLKSFLSKIKKYIECYDESTKRVKELQLRLIKAKRESLLYGTIQSIVLAKLLQDINNSLKSGAN